MPGPCCSQPACVPLPGPSLVEGSSFGPGQSLAVPVEQSLVLLRAFLPPVPGASFSAKGEATTSICAANAQASPCA